MSSDTLDLLLVSPGNNRIIYQELANEFAAIEPPIWCGLLAGFARQRGYSVQIVDQEAEGLDAAQVAARVSDAKPRLTAVVVYGQQPSASTQNMTASQEICTAIRESGLDTVTIMIGGHVSALPEQSLAESDVDFVCQGEGPQTLDGLLQLSDIRDETEYSKIPGLWYHSNGTTAFTQHAKLISRDELPSVMPGITWDLLPMDVYRAHNWHCFDHINERQPYASLYTSLGCPYRCSFCCINAPFETPEKAQTFRYWDPEWTIEQLDTLANTYGVRNVKIADEMFVLHDKHFLRLCELIIERGYDFNFWAYARVDTVKDHHLEKLKKAGFNWLALGIESKSRFVRDGVDKGRFGEDDIYAVVRKIKDAGINVLGNYIFGLPDDDYGTMQETLTMAMDLNCEMANFYSAMAYPGSRLYHDAIQKQWSLPDGWHNFSQHAYETRPLPTDHLAAEEVLGFRDWAWNTYFTNPNYVSLVRQKFGENAASHIAKMTAIKLKRKFAATNSADTDE